MAEDNLHRAMPTGGEGIGLPPDRQRIATLENEMRLANQCLPALHARIDKLERQQAVLIKLLTALGAEMTAIVDSPAR